MSQSVKEYAIVITLAVGFLGLMRWNAIQQNASLVDGSANEHIVENEIHFKNFRLPQNEFFEKIFLENDT